jgi:hypothetical protein
MEKWHKLVQQQKERLSAAGKSLPLKDLYVSRRQTMDEQLLRQHQSFVMLSGVHKEEQQTSTPDNKLKIAVCLSYFRFEERLLVVFIFCICLSFPLDVFSRLLLIHSGPPQMKFSLKIVFTTNISFK